MRIDTGGVSICRGRFTCPRRRYDIAGTEFELALAAIPSGYGEGVYEGLRYGVAVRKSRDGKRTSLFARALAGGDVVSFNLYRLRSGEGFLRPCEMPAEKVVAFVLGYPATNSF